MERKNASHTPAPPDRDRHRPRITVVGAVNVDITGTPLKPLIQRDSNPGRVTVTYGGVGRNIADNLARLGLNVELITVLGDDVYSAAIKNDCAAHGIGLKYSRQVPGSATSSYLCINDEHGDMTVAINDMALIDSMTPAVLAETPVAINDSDLLVIDANLPESSIRYLAERVTVPIVAEPVSTHKAARLIPVLNRLQLLKPNRIEAEILSGVPIRDESGLKRAAAALLERGVRQVCISLGREGVYFADADSAGQISTLPGKTVNTTGCGDAFVAAGSWGVCHGLELSQIARLGLAAAAICLEWPGAISPDMTLEHVIARSGLNL